MSLWWRGLDLLSRLIPSTGTLTRHYGQPARLQEHCGGAAAHNRCHIRNSTSKVSHRGSKMRNVTVSTSWGMVAAVFLSFLCVIQLGSLVANTAASSRAHSRHVYKNMWEYTHAVGDLPALLSSTHGPNSTSWTNSVAICAVMKEENSTDVREWLLYYQYAVNSPLALSSAARPPQPLVGSCWLHFQQHHTGLGVPTNISAWISRC